MSVTIGRCYYVPIEKLEDAIEAVCEIGRSGRTPLNPVVLPDGRVVQGPFEEWERDLATKKLQRTSAKLSGPDDAISGEITIRTLLDDTIRENLDPETDVRRTRDRNGNRFVYLKIDVALVVGMRFAEVSFSSESQGIGTIVALPGSVRDLLDHVESRADGVLAAEYANGSLAAEMSNGHMASTDEDMAPDEIVAFFRLERDRVAGGGPPSTSDR